jgi:hypothetical protein
MEMHLDPVIGVLRRINDHSASRLDARLHWNWKARPEILAA